jgi:CO/xanthine dehydrogenase FAD-binding subunit
MAFAVQVPESVDEAVATLGEGRRLLAGGTSVVPWLNNHNLFVPAPHGDFAVCLLALDAEVTVVDAGGSRTVGVADVAPGPLVTSVRFDVPERWF